MAVMEVYVVHTTTLIGGGDDTPYELDAVIGHFNEHSEIRYESHRIVEDDGIIIIYEALFYINEEYFQRMKLIGCMEQYGISTVGIDDHQFTYSYSVKTGLEYGE